MLSTRNKLRLAILAAAALLLGGGCSVYDKDTCPEGRSYGKVVMDIVVPSSSLPTKVATKAAWGDGYSPYEDGDKYDNWINLNTLQILFYTADEERLTYVAALKDYDIIPVDGSGKYETKNAYRVVGEVNTAEGKKLTPGEYKVVVLANCPTADSEKALTSLKYNDFFANFDRDEENVQFNPVPMWGMATKTFNFRAGEEDNIGSISLLRATAKLEMTFNWNEKFRQSHTEEQISKIKFKSVELLWGEKAVNCLPNFVLSDTDETEDIDQETCFNPVNGVAAYSPYKAFKLYSDDKVANLIVPEYTIGTNPSTSSSASSDADDENSESGSDAVVSADKAVFRIVIEEEPGIELEFYLDPTITITGPNGPAAFVRNHLYRFKIVYYNASGLYIVPEVMPWTVESEIDYESSITTSLSMSDQRGYRRIDLDGDWDSWAESYMAVSYGYQNSDGQGVLNPTINDFPQYSSRILLYTVAKGVDLQLNIDSDKFKFVLYHEKEETYTDDQGIEQTRTLYLYDHSYSGGQSVFLPAGTNYTYFYVVPVSQFSNDATVEEKKCKVFLTTVASSVGAIKIPINYSALPGNSEGSDEIWVYYVNSNDYTDNSKCHPIAP